MLYIQRDVFSAIMDTFNRRKTKIGLSGCTVGEYFAHGAMADVYRVVSASGISKYVLRISEEQKSPYSQDVFNLREMEVMQELKRIHQPHVVQFLDAFTVQCGDSPKYYCSVMKMLTPLSHFKDPSRYPEIAVRLGSDLLPLLQSLSEKEIIHRDIKPENIFFDKDFTNQEGFLLGDFGVAKTDTQATMTAVGTISTMAPEVRGLDRELGASRSRSDLYSLGIVMYYYLNGGCYPPNDERTDRFPPDRNPFCLPLQGSDRLKQLVIRATQYHPDDRFSSPAEMLSELKQCEEYDYYIVKHNTGAMDIPFSPPPASPAGSMPYQRSVPVVPANRQQQNSDPFNNSPSYITVNDSRGSSDPFYPPVASNPAWDDNGKGYIKPALIIACLAVLCVLVMAVMFREKPDSAQDKTEPTGYQESEAASEPDETDQTEDYSFEENDDEISVGDTVILGNYKQRKDGSAAPIKWTVLTVQNNCALVISEKLLDYVPYNDDYTLITWENCSLRVWMNSDFLYEAFDDEEQKKIATVLNDTPDNEEYGTNGGRVTRDKIFALSAEEAQKYFASASQRIAYTTDYAHSKGYDSNDRSDWWWLRSPADYDYPAMRVSSKGALSSTGTYENFSRIAVRPAFWLRIG